MSSEDFRIIKLQKDFLKSIDQYMKENQDLGFTSRADFIRHCIRKEMEK